MVLGGGKKVVGTGGNRLPSIARMVWDRNEHSQLTESVPEPPERRFQRFELPGSLSGACRGATISDNPRVTKTQTKAVGSTGCTH